MFSFLSLFAFGLSAVDPLFLKMAGQWVGEGDRFFPESQRRVHLEARVDSSLGANDTRLLSRNWIKEIAQESPGVMASEPKEYARLYWVSAQDPKADALPRLYDFGYGEASTNPSAQGTFDGDTLVVRQELGGAPAYLVVSTTHFVSEDETDYVERAYHGDDELAETRIRYRRVAAVSGL